MKYIKLNAFTLDLNLSKNELIIYNYLLTINDFIGYTGHSKIYLSYNQISYECKIPRRSVIRTVYDLCKKELIDKKAFKDGIQFIINQSKRKERNISLLLDELKGKWNKND